MQMPIKKIILILALLVMSCARQKTINLQEHSYNQFPSKVIILQVPGLSQDHFSYITFSSETIGKQANVDRMSCFGNMWSYNLVEMMPSVNQGVISQMNGSPGSDKKCDAYQKIPVWTPLQGFDYKSAYLERDGSIYDEAISCNQEFFKDISVISSLPKSSTDPQDGFHFQHKISLSNGQRQKDLTCSKGSCFSTTADNFSAVWKSMKNIKNRMMLITDYSLYNSIKENNKEKFYSSISDINEIVGKIIREIVEIDKDTLFVLSSTNSYQIDWKNNIDWNKFSIKRNLSRSLTSPVWSKGAMAENFCGTFREYEFFKRVFYRSEKIEFPLKDFFGF